MDQTGGRGEVMVVQDGKSSEQGIAADILIKGAGRSGLRAAIEAKERGMSVIVVSTRRKADAHTVRDLRSSRVVVTVIRFVSKDGCQTSDKVP